MHSKLRIQNIRRDAKKQFYLMKFITWSTKKIFVHSLNSIKSSRKNIWKEFKRLQHSYDLEICRIIQQLAFALVCSFLCFDELCCEQVSYMCRPLVMSYGSLRHFNNLLLFEHETHPRASRCFCWITPERHCTSEPHKIETVFKLLSSLEISN